MIFQAIIFFCIVILLFGAINFYIGAKMLVIISAFNQNVNKNIFWITLWIIATSFILGTAGAKILKSKIFDFCSLIGGYWIAFMFYFTIIFIIFDVLRLIVKVTPFTNWFISIEKYIGIGLIFLTVSIIIYGSINASNTIFKTYKIDIAKKTNNVENLKIIMVSDLHIGNIIGKSEIVKLVDKINSKNPDVVFFCGDIIDSDIQPFINQELYKEFLKIKSKNGVFGVLGNHEYYGNNLPQTINQIKKSGIKLLIDEVYKVNNDFYIVGRDEGLDESKGNNQRKPLKLLLNEVDKSLPIILLDHKPIDIKVASENMVDLQLSGHTHYGQLYPASYITGKIFDLDYGHLKIKNYNLIVSSGFGTWGPRVRVGSSSEIVEIIMQIKNKE